MSATEFILVKVLGSMVAPPGVVILLALLGFVLFPFARRLAALMVLVAVGSLYALSTPIVASALERGLYNYSALSLSMQAEPPAELIVVLGGGSQGTPLNHQGLQVAGGPTLERLRYAASLHRHTGLPLLVAGGSALAGTPPEAELMVRSLQDDFGIGVRFVEGRSLNTAENAAFSAALLGGSGITRVLLVTHAHHMSRSVAAFERQGLHVTPAPVVSSDGPLSFAAFLPRANALAGSAAALHEYVGSLWYWLRYAG